MLYVNPSEPEKESSDAERLLRLEEVSLFKISFLWAFSFKLLLNPEFEICTWLPDIPERKLPEPMEVESL